MLSKLVASLLLVGVFGQDEPNDRKTCPRLCKTWFDGCVSCACDEETGEATCREGRECFAAGESYCSEFYSCPEGCESFYDGCNTCRCDAATGEILGCTDQDCTTHGRPQCNSFGKCPEGCLRFNDGCNTCQCADDGSLESCTEMACFTQGKPYCEEWEGNCPPTCDGSWFDGCNTCDCDLGVCTTMPCREDQKERPRCIPKSPETTANPDEKCWSGCSHYFDGCDWCRCNLDTGAERCTKNECDRREEPFCFVYRRDACPDPNCDVWDDGCNTCYCDHETGKHKCTDYDCFTQGDPKCVSCQSNFVFDKDGDACWQQNTCENYPVLCRAMSRPMCTCPDRLPIYDEDTNSCVSRDSCKEERCGCQSLKPRRKKWNRICAAYETKRQCLRDSSRRCEWHCE